MRAILLAALILVGCTTAPQPPPQFETLIDKAKIAQIFQTTRPQWRTLVAGLTERHAAFAVNINGNTMIGSRNPGGYLVLITPDFIYGADSPDLIRITLGYEPPVAEQIDATETQRIIDIVRENLQPNYVVDGIAELIGDTVAIQLTITRARASYL